jgi:hypothetical protein
MDISHMITRDGVERGWLWDSLIQLNDPKGELLKEFFKENSKVFHSFVNYNHAIDFNCNKLLSYTANAKGVGLSGEMNCPSEVSNINPNLEGTRGLALRMRKSYFEKIRGNQIVIKVQGSDPILYYPPRSRIPHIWVPRSTRIVNALDTLKIKKPLGPIMPHNCKW